jgi:hypothetical protein
MYVAYVDGILEGFTNKILLMYVEGIWSYPSSDQQYRGKVYGYIGTLPTPKIKELCKRKDKKFAVGSIKDATNGAFVAGPFDSVKEALNEYGEKDWCIVRLIINKEPKIIYMWNDIESKWEKER